MLPRLTAEESMAAAQRVSVGAGKLTSDARLAITRTWEEQADLPGRRRAQKPSESDLANMGITVVRVPKVQTG